MSDFWWSLPGPSAFLGRVGDDLRSGKAVVLCLPEHAPADLDVHVRRGYQYDWRRLSADELGDDPAEALYDYFHPDAPPEQPRSCRTLLQLDRFLGQAVMIEIRCPERWRRWKPFLTEYEERVRAVPPEMRAMLCVVLRGAVAADPPAGAVALIARPWMGAVGEFDMALWCAHLMQDHGTNPTVRRVAISVVARLAIWDRSVAARFAEERTQHIFEPIDLLREIAHERGWTPQGGGGVTTWHRGQRCHSDGRAYDHSAALAIVGARESIQHRVWTGQVGVLFPFVEERRRGLLRGLATRLQVPHVPYRGAKPIDDVRELELRHIYNQVSRRPDLPDWLPTAIDTLVMIRNAIAHFEVVPEHLLSDESLRFLMRATEYQSQQ